MQQRRNIRGLLRFVFYLSGNHNLLELGNLNFWQIPSTQRTRSQLAFRNVNTLVYQNKVVVRVSQLWYQANSAKEWQNAWKDKCLSDPGWIAGFLHSSGIYEWLLPVLHNPSTEIIQSSKYEDWSSKERAPPVDDDFSASENGIGGKRSIYVTINFCSSTTDLFEWFQNNEIVTASPKRSRITETQNQINLKFDFYFQCEFWRIGMFRTRTISGSHTRSKRSQKNGAWLTFTFYSLSIR